MKTVIITGCNGFIGKKLTKYLLDKNITVIGMDITESNNNCDRFIFQKFDFNLDLVSILSKHDVDVLYHLAWCGVSTIDKNNPDKQFVNINLTYKVLELANSLGVKKIVIPGSMSEFSRCTEPVTGEEPDSPSDLYAATKVAIRKIAYQYCEKNNLDLNWMLITSVYGMERNDANLITYVINNLKDNKEVKTTKLEQKWDYIHIDDLMLAFYLIGDKGETNTIYPVGSGEVMMLKEYVMIIARLIGKENLLGIGELQYKNKYIDNSIPDLHALSAIGYVSKGSFKDNITSIIRHSDADN